jgi:hypothetical protein
MILAGLPLEVPAEDLRADLTESQGQAINRKSLIGEDVRSTPCSANRILGGRLRMPNAATKIIFIGLPHWGSSGCNYGKNLVNI